MVMQVVVPAAGRSSRFPGMRPKYLLYAYDSQLMITRSLKGLLHFPITIGILEEHQLQYNAIELMDEELCTVTEPTFVVLPKETKGPAETVYQAIIQNPRIKDDDELFIKDCDSFFEAYHGMSGNYVCTAGLEERPDIRNVAAKSYVTTNDQEIITSIVEKCVVSNRFCVGGYKFESVGLYKKLFEEIVGHQKELFVSDVITRGLYHRHIFKENTVREYVDVGTLQEWREYNDRPVIICDIDGTLIRNQGRVGFNKYGDKPIPLAENVKRLLELQEKGSRFIFTTSRPSYLEGTTNELLYNLGFNNFDLVCGLGNVRRILINDFSPTNPYPSASAINIERDGDDLKKFL